MSRGFKTFLLLVLAFVILIGLATLIAATLGIDLAWGGAVGGVGFLIAAFLITDSIYG